MCCRRIRRACPDRGLAAQGAVTVLTAPPGSDVGHPGSRAIRRQATVSSMPRRRSGSQQQCPVGAEPQEPGACLQEAILGVDTHKDVHVAAVISPVGALLGTQDFPATAAGYRALLAWARTFGAVLRAGVEGTASYGAALNRMLPAGPGRSTAPGHD